ncbi:MAG: hypothetical protein R2878_01050 [Thermoleophilia bacterium]
MASDTQRGLLSSGTIVLFGIASWTLGNFLFFVLAARIIGADEFGLVAALLAVGVAALVPCGAIQASIGRAVAGGVATPATVPRLHRISWVWAGAVGLLGTLTILGLWMLHDIPGAALLITLFGLLPLVPLHVLLGAIQGRSRFVWSAATMVVLGWTRPVMLVPLSATIDDRLALAASAGSVAAAYGVAFLFHIRVPRTGDDRPETVRHIVVPMMAAVAALLGVGLATNADVVAGKLGLPAPLAGQFGALAPLGRTAVLIVPMALGFVLLPRVALLRRSGRPTRPLLGLAAVATVGLGLATAIAIAPLTHLIVRIFGPDYAAADHLLVPIVLAAVPLGVVVVTVNHAIALARTRLLWLMAATSLSTIVGLTVFHERVGQLLGVDAASTIAILVVHDLADRRGDTLSGGVLDLIRRVR